MQTEEQILRRKRQIRQRQKLIKICKMMLTVGAVGGLIVGILLTSLISMIKSHSTETAFNEQLQEQTAKTKELQEKYQQTAQGQGELAADADWNMILINGNVGLDESFKVKLKEVEEGYEADYRIVEAAKDMLKACRDEGLSPMVVSGYRDNAYQESIFNRTMGEWMNKGYSYMDAYNETLKSVQLPGYSEHATGLALDIVSATEPDLDETQAETEEAKWLMEHCAEYGFILRYPPEKSDITGIIYEPWHYRYVGTEVAQEIMSQGITLEEYYMR